MSTEETPSSIDEFSRLEPSTVQSDETSPGNLAHENRKSEHHAVALSYSDTSTLPRIVAAGKGSLAQKIIEIAQNSGIPIRQNQDLAELLEGLPAGSSIPPESFRLVAEIVSFLYHVDRGSVENRGTLESSAAVRDTPNLK